MAKGPTQEDLFFFALLCLILGFAILYVIFKTA